MLSLKAVQAYRPLPSLAPRLQALESMQYNRADATIACHHCAELALARAKPVVGADERPDIVALLVFACEDRPASYRAL